MTLTLQAAQSSSGIRKTILLPRIMQPRPFPLPKNSRLATLAAPSSLEECCDYPWALLGFGGNWTWDVWGRKRGRHFTRQFPTGKKKKHSQSGKYYLTLSMHLRTRERPGFDQFRLLAQPLRADTVWPIPTPGSAIKSRQSLPDSDFYLSGHQEPGFGQFRLLARPSRARKNIFLNQMMFLV